MITNNRENIEGSRQILRGIQKVKRLKSQEPIKVTLALTRIPFPQNDEDKKIEQKIIEDIKSFLNKGGESLDEQLNVSDVLVPCLKNSVPGVGNIKNSQITFI